MGSSTALSSPAAFTPPRAASALTTASTTSPATPRSTLAGTSTPSSARTAAPSPRSPPTLAMEFTVTFADKPGQTGVQYLFEYDTNARGAGSFPVSAGIATVAGQTVVELLAAADVGTVSELSECSDRGLDNGDGECECFDGFRGLACEEQEALV